MQNLTVVRRRETRTELTREFQSLVRRQSANSAQQRREILAVDVFHGEKVVAGAFADVIHAAHVWMRNLPGESNFLKEAREPVVAIGDVAWQELERNSLCKFQVLGAIDLAHAAAAQQADDPVAAGQYRACDELRAVERARRRRPIGLDHGQRRRLRPVIAGAAFRAIAARCRNVTPAGRTTHGIGLILVVRGRHRQTSEVEGLSYNPAEVRV